MKNIMRAFVVASAAFFVVSAHAQNVGSIATHAVPISKGPGQQGYGALGPCNSGIPFVGKGASTDPACGQVDLTAGVTGLLPIANGGTNASTAANARTNLGLAIGTNVEAWDADLDCLAGLSSTGVIHRTGSGTCSAGTIALSDLATGTQDTVIGYFGSTAASALAINDCSNALTYSTSTHTFGCNSSAGTGTVTSVGLSNTFGLSISGSPVTASGNISAGVSLTRLTSSLGADVSMNVANTYFSGPSVAQGTTGTWLATGSINLLDAGAATAGQCKLWDGTTVIASGSVGLNSNNQQLALSGVITSPAGNIRIDCKDTNTATGLIKFNNSGNSKDSTLSVVRIQ